ncbi:MAG TPA: SDR family NAD(P)-dependent oxidoreductase [Steroidobacteraceae bacterium]|nr:SDR family NAD(P)-dependent oxidoreductase [Steroidobacteraceae bacterium]
MKDVNGKVAFITGGASGIGLGIAKACANAGMKVVIADLRDDHIEESLGFFKGKGQAAQLHALKLDVTDRPAYARAADEAEKVFGKIHVLCNNAGMGLVGPLKLLKFADWDWGLGVMIGGVVNGLQIIVPRILKHGEGGHIVNTSSMSAIVPIPNTVIYTTAKGALVAMAETLRGELAPDNIGVSAFCPGPVQTNIRETGKLRPAEFRDSGLIESEKRLADRPNSPNWMSLEECGERVLRGIQRNDLYIFTHAEFRAGAAERCETLLASFPEEPINTTRAGEIGFLTSNAIFSKAQRPRW